MDFPRKFSRWLVIAVAAVVMMAIVAAVIGALWLLSALPQTQGRAVIAGLQQPVAIDRDMDGIPHIQAKSDHDAYLALGFVHAQDRLWQMETTRRFGAGRLSAVIGPSFLGTDKFMRTLGVYRAAEDTFARAPPDIRAAILAYTDGVNAYLTSHAGAWPVEYYLLGMTPEPWRPADSLVWGQIMGLRLAGDWRDELTRQALSARLTPAQISALLDDPDDGPVTIEAPHPQHKADANRPPPGAGQSTTIALDNGTVRRLAAFLPPWLGPHSASNSWVLSGQRTTTGKPLLANDPHLALESPSTWYLARVSAPGLSVAGATAPGVPFHVLGHNGRIAWGFTNTGSDAQDLFVEKRDPADPTRYLTPDGPQPFVTRQDIIQVRDAEDVVLTVRATRHGPVLSDLTEATQPGMSPGDVLALASTGQRSDDTTAEALYRLNRATDWAQFTDALRGFQYPQQNIVYADVTGNIGFYVAGRVPIRRSGDGARPVPGWTGSHDWIGFIPFEDLPHSLNPPSGRLVNANNRVVGREYPYALGRGWAPPYRARRIEALLDRATRHPPDDMVRIQGDVISLSARELLPLMLPAARTLPAPTPMARDAVQLLGDWTAVVDADLPQPLIFNAWLRELNRVIYGDELGAEFAPLSRSLRPRFIVQALTTNPQWCDDITTAAIETCETQLQTALSAALDSLAAHYGPVPRRWRWGAAHRVRFAHRMLNRIPVIGRWSDVVLATPGDDSTVNRGTTSIHDPAAPFAHVHGPSLRAIYDLGDLAKSRFILAGGQSGNRLSPLYGNMTERWRRLAYITLSAPAAQSQRLLLVPTRSPL